MNATEREGIVSEFAKFRNSVSFKTECVIRKLYNVDARQ